MRERERKREREKEREKDKIFIYLKKIQFSYIIHSLRVVFDFFILAFANLQKILLIFQQEATLQLHLNQKYLFQVLHPQ